MKEGHSCSPLCLMARRTNSQPRLQAGGRGPQQKSDGNNHQLLYRWRNVDSNTNSRGTLAPHAPSSLGLEHNPNEIAPGREAMVV